MGLEQAMKANRANIKPTDGLSRHEWNKILEALPTLVRYKQNRLKRLTEEYRLQRATLGQEINDINKLINKIRERL